MEASREFLANNWIYLVIGGSLVLFIGPWLFVWWYRRNRRWIVENGQSAPAKILKFWSSSLTIGGSSGNRGGNMRGVNLLLEIYPQNGQPYQVKTREQLHLFDISRVAPGLIVEVHIHPNKPKKVVVSRWGPP